MLIFCAVIFAVALNRLVIYLKRFYLDRITAVCIIIAAMIIFINLLLLLILSSFIEQFQSLLNILSKVNDQINDLINWINNFDDSKYDYFLFFYLNTFIVDYSFVSENLINNFIAFFSNVVVVIFQIIFVFVLTIIFLLNPAQYRYYFR